MNPPPHTHPGPTERANPELFARALAHPVAVAAAVGVDNAERRIAKLHDRRARLASLIAATDRAIEQQSVHRDALWAAVLLTLNQPSRSDP